MTNLLQGFGDKVDKASGGAGQGEPGVRMLGGHWRKGDTWYSRRYIWAIQSWIGQIELRLIYKLIYYVNRFLPFFVWKAG